MRHTRCRTMKHARCLRSARGVARALPAMLACLTASTGACDLITSDSGMPDDGTEPFRAIVSDPSAASAPAGAAGVGPSFAETAASYVYVSLRPNSFGSGDQLEVLNESTGLVHTMPLIDGGLDPVAVPAATGDTLRFTVMDGATALDHWIEVVTEYRSPTVVRTSPPDGKRDVPINFEITVVFSEPMDPASVTSTNVRLIDGEVPIHATAVPSGDGLTLELELVEVLEPRTAYALVLGGGLTDADGDQLDAPVQVEFVTGGTSDVEPGPEPGVVFATQPVAVGEGLKITPPVRVAVRDGSGVIDADYDGDVAVSLESNPGAGVLSGTTTVQAVDGVAVFSDLRIDAAGEGYTLTAAAAGVPAKVSRPFDVVPSAPPWGRIAFSGGVDEQTFGIYVMNADGSGVTRLSATPPGDQAGDAAWSPDGSRIAFSYADLGIMPDSTFVHVMNADGSGVVRVTGGDRYTTSAEGPDWSPDGTRLVFVSSDDGDRDVFVINADGSGRTRLPNQPEGDAYYPAWSPDGTLIAVCIASHVGTGSALWVVPTDGSPPLRLVETTDVQEMRPAWSPDGAIISYTLYDWSTSGGTIHVIASDGSGGAQLTATGAAGSTSSTTWSPDGTYIMYTGSHDGSGGLVMMRADGSNTRFVAPGSLPAWHAGVGAPPNTPGS